MKSVLVLLLLLGAALPAHAEKLLTVEPGKGGLHAGERVLVDDHTCPPGYVKEGIGGSNVSYRNGVRTPGTARQVRCVPH